METINTTKLRTTLSSILKRVRDGEIFQIMNRQTPIAILSPDHKDPLRVAKHAEHKFSAPRSIKIKNLTNLN